MVDLAGLIASYNGLDYVYSAKPGKYTFVAPSSFTENGLRQRGGRVVVIEQGENCITSLVMDNGHGSAIITPNNKGQTYMVLRYVPYIVNIVEKKGKNASLQECKIIPTTLYDVELVKVISDVGVFEERCEKEFEQCTFAAMRSGFLSQLLLPKTKTATLSRKVDLNSLDLLMQEARRYKLLDHELEFIVGQRRDYVKRMMDTALANLVFLQKDTPHFTQLWADVRRVLREIPLPTTPDEMREVEKYYKPEVRRYFDLKGATFFTDVKEHRYILNLFLASEGRDMKRFGSLQWQEEVYGEIIPSVQHYVDSQKAMFEGGGKTLPAILLEQTRLLDVYHRAKTQYQEMINLFVAHNIRLVFNRALPFIKKGKDTTEAMANGMVGLRKAAMKYKWERGYKFSTYAAWWIRQNIDREDMDTGETIRKPVHLRTFLDKLHYVQGRFWQQQCRYPTLEELAEIVDAPVRRIKRALESPGECRSLYDKVGDLDDRDGASVIDFIDGSDAEQLRGFVHVPLDVHTAAEGSNMGLKVHQMLILLTPREESVIRYRFGIGVEEKTLEEVGQMMGLTRERIRQIEMIVIKKLGRRLESRGITADYLDRERNKET